MSAQQKLQKVNTKYHSFSLLLELNILVINILSFTIYQPNFTFTIS